MQVSRRSRFFSYDSAQWRGTGTDLKRGGEMYSYYACCSRSRMTIAISPSLPCIAGTEHVGFSSTTQTSREPCAKRREVFCALSRRVGGYRTSVRGGKNYISLDHTEPFKKHAHLCLSSKSCVVLRPQTLHWQTRCMYVGPAQFFNVTHEVTQEGPVLPGGSVREETDVSICLSANIHGAVLMHFFLRLKKDAKWLCCLSPHVASF